jgi:hypothetical protein
LYKHFDCRLRSGNFTGTQAAGAGMNAAGLTVDKSLYAHYIRFPSTVGTSVGVGHFNTKRYAFSAEITFRHFSAPPFGLHNSIILSNWERKINPFLQEIYFFLKSNHFLACKPPVCMI